MKLSVDLKKSMIGFCLLIGIIPFLIIGVYCYKVASDSLSKKAFEELTALRDVKKHGAQDRIETWFAEMDMLAGDEFVLDAFYDFRGYLKMPSALQNGAIDVESGTYNLLFNQYVEHFARYVDNLGFYDVFIIDPEGRVLFTVTRESDLGQNLSSGWLKDSPLAKAWKKALKSDDVFVDFEPYEPSNGIPAAFLAEPVRKNGELLCVVALQVSLDRLNDFMQLRSGMGETGETFLVGQDMLMRSDSSLHPEHTVAASFENPQEGSMDYHAVRAGLDGETGAEILKDHDNNEVLAAYTPVAVGDTTWALIASMDKSEAFAAVSRLRRDAVIVGGVVFVAIILVTVLFNRRELLRPFDALRSFAHQVAEGDLDARPEGRFKPELADLRDSILSMVANLKTKMTEAEEKSIEAEQQADKAQAALGEAEAQQEKVNALLEKMRTIADQANVIAERVSSSSDELAAQVEQVSRGAEMQRDRVGETATAMEQMNSTVMEVASNASNASANSDKAREKAASGASIVNEVVQAITRVNTLAEELKGNTETLSSQAESIGKVMDVISDIADQTNLLALNAAIEAARAGEAGRGFAVVADEVRKLAEKTMSATKEVGDNIARVQDATRRNMGSVDQAVEAVADATDKANESGVALNEIVGLVEQSASQVTGIATAAEEQSAASEQISQSVEEINRIVAETAEGMVQSAHAVQELSTMANELRKIIHQLNMEQQ